MFHCLIALFALLVGAPALADESLVILKTPVKVVAHYEEPRYQGEDCGLFTVTLSVSHAGNSSSEEALPLRCGNARETLKTQMRKLVSWRAPYLALHTNCGMSNGWNCDTQVIYAYRSGKLTRLGHVNQILLRSGQTLFSKYYTVLEYNELTAHGGTPVPLVLRDAGSAFAFDANMTWAVNREHFSRFDRRELRCEPNKAGCDHKFKAAVVFNSTLAKLTGKQAELESTLATAKKRLSQDEFKQLTDMLAQVDEKGVIAHMSAETY